MSFGPSLNRKYQYQHLFVVVIVITIVYKFTVVISQTECKVIVFLLKRVVTVLLIVIRAIVCGLWRGVCAVGLCTKAGADKSSVSVCLGAAGGGLS